jgi:hypothetical protein
MTHPNGRYVRRTPNGDQYAALVWKRTQAEPRKLRFGTPAEALLTGVEYLRSGYQVRLSDGAVQALSGNRHAAPRELMRQQLLAELAAMDPASRAELLSRHPASAPAQPARGIALVHSSESGD